MNVAGNVAAETMLFVRTAGLGVVMGAAYDCLRIFRKGISHRKEWVDREDLVFWICAGLLFFEFLIYYYQGKLRFFEIAAVCFGAWLCQSSHSPGWRKRFCRIYRFVRKMQAAGVQTNKMVEKWM